MTTSRPDVRLLVSHPAHLVALGLGSGLAPLAPGTFGTLAALPLYALLATFVADPGARVAVIAVAFALGVWACARTGRALGVADHGAIVWDEIVAFALVLAATPPTPLWIAAAFVAFRFFDIVKPWPIRQFDARLKNGFGVMFDDLLAALYTLALLKGLQWLV
jgi:phosphatidylglycerophosphatase A